MCLPVQRRRRSEMCAGQPARASLLANGAALTSDQSALGSKTPLQAMKKWHKLKPAMFKKRPYFLPGYDNYEANRTNLRKRFFNTIVIKQTSRTGKGEGPFEWYGDDGTRLSVKCYQTVYVLLFLRIRTAELTVFDEGAVLDEI